MLIIHQTISLFYSHQLIWIWFNIFGDRIETFVLDSVDNWTGPFPTKEYFVLIDCPVGSFVEVGGVSTFTILEVLDYDKITMKRVQTNNSVDVGETKSGY